MKAFIAMFLVVAASPAFAQVGQCGRQVEPHAARLESAAAHLAQSLRSARANAHLQDTADRFKNSAHHLHETAHNARGCEHLRRDVQELNEQFEHLAQDIERAHEVHHDRHIRQDVREVRQALRAATQAVQHGGHGHGHGHPVTTNVTLGSSRYRLNQQAMPGTITNVVLLQQLSNSACVMGSSFGFNGNVLWVNRGCQGSFQVTYLHAR